MAGHHSPTAVPIEGFGDAIVTSSEVDEVVMSLIHVGLPRVGRGVETKWAIDLYPEEALALALALIEHARALVT